MLSTSRRHGTLLPVRLTLSKNVSIGPTQSFFSVVKCISTALARMMRKTCVTLVAGMALSMKPIRSAGLAMLVECFPDCGLTKRGVRGGIHCARYRGGLTVDTTEAGRGWAEDASTQGVGTQVRTQKTLTRRKLQHFLHAPNLVAGRPSTAPTWTAQESFSPSSTWEGVVCRTLLTTRGR